MQSQVGRYGPETLRALSLWVVMNRAMASLSRKIEGDIRERGFSLTEWGVLEHLYHKGPQPMAKLGDQILVTGGSVTYVVDKLEKRGLVRRDPCQHDRRIIYAVLTESGTHVMQDEFPKHAAKITSIMSVLNQEEQESVRELLKRLGLSAAGKLDPDNKSASERMSE